MPLADPSTSDVLDVIRQRLQVLYTYDTDKYSTLVSEVVLPSREFDDNALEEMPQAPKDSQIVVSIGGMTRIRDLDCPGNPPRQAWRIEFRIRLRLMPSETDNEDIDTKLLRFVRDVRKAIVSDANGDYVSDWYTFGGKALIADWGDEYERLINDGTSQSDGYVLPLLVDMRLNENSL